MKSKLSKLTDRSWVTGKGELLKVSMSPAPCIMYRPTDDFSSVEPWAHYVSEDLVRLILHPDESALAEREAIARMLEEQTEKNYEGETEKLLRMALHWIRNGLQHS